MTGRPVLSARPTRDHKAPNVPRLPAAPVALPRHRRRSMLFLGVALTGLDALAAAWIFTTTSHRAAVLVTDRNIAIGSVIRQSDLRIADISAGSGVASIPAGQESQVTGHVAAVDLRAGTVIGPEDLATTVEPTPGEV